jgi:aspartyl protease
MFRRALLVMCAACGSSGDHHNMGSPDAAGSAADAAAPDAPVSADGVYAIPLTTPDESFWGPQVTIGGQAFMMDLDTGSTTIGVAGATCSQCTGVTPLYAPGTTAVDEHKTASTQYADNSGWSGEIYKDAVGLGQGSPSVPVDVVAMTRQRQFFYQNQYQGIFGLGAPENAEPSTGAYFDIAAQAGLTPVMAFELCPDGGTMWIGGFDATRTADAPRYTPLIPISGNQPFYAIDISSMSIGGTVVGTGAATFQQPVVDTGTTYFYLPTGVETAVINAINSSTGFKALFGASAQVQDDPNDTGIGCVTAAGVTGAMVDASLPPMTIAMPAVGGGTDVTVSVKPLQSYMYDAGGGKFCLGIGDGGTQDATTMGDQIMQAFVTIIDLQHQQVGWAPDAGCGPAPRRPRDMTTFHPHPPKRHRRS